MTFLVGILSCFLTLRKVRCFFYLTVFNVKYIVILFDYKCLLKSFSAMYICYDSNCDFFFYLHSSSSDNHMLKWINTQIYMLFNETIFLMMLAKQNFHSLVLLFVLKCDMLNPKQNKIIHRLFYEWC